MSMIHDERGRIIGGHWREPKPYYDADWCRVEYVGKGRSASEIASEFGVTDTAVVFWLRKHGIERRSTSEARARKHWGVTGDANPMHGRRGPLNPNYKDGSSPERQRLYASGEGRALLRAVYERDGYRCQECGAGGHHNGIHPPGMTHDVTPAPKRTLGFEPSCPHGDGSASGIVLDPFAGSGTTLMVAAHHRRDSIGIELSSDYAQMARERIRAALDPHGTVAEWLGQGDLFGDAA